MVKCQLLSSEGLLLLTNYLLQQKMVNKKSTTPINKTASFASDSGQTSLSGVLIFNDLEYDEDIVNDDAKMKEILSELEKVSAKYQLINFSDCIKRSETLG